MAESVDLGSVFAKLEMQTKQFEDGINKSTKKLDSFSKKIGKTMAKVGKVIAKGMAVGGAALAGVGIVSAKMAEDFDYAMRYANTMMQATEKEMKAMKKTALDLATHTGKAATDIMESYYGIASAGYKGAEANDILKVATEGAVGGFIDQDKAVNALVKVMSIYKKKGDEAEKTMDVMFGTVDKGLLTFDDLTGSFANASKFAVPLNLTVEEMGAAHGFLSKKMASASEAATGLMGLTRAFIKPSETMKNLTKEWANEQGLAADTTSAQMMQTLGLEGAMKLLDKATNGNVETMGELIPEAEGLSSALYLTSKEGAKELSVNLDYLNKSAGLTKEKFDEASKSAKVKFSKSMEELKGHLIVVGEELLPIATEALALFVEKIRESKDKIVALKDKIIEIKNTIIDWVAGIKKSIEENEALEVIISTMEEALSKLWTVLGELKDEWAELQKILAPLMPDLTLLAKIIGGILFGAVLGVIGVLIIIVTAFKNTIKIIKTVIIWFKELWSKIRIGVGNIIIWFQKLPGRVWSAIKGVGWYLVNAFVKAKTIGKDAVNGIIDWFKTLPSKVWDAIKGVGSYIIKAFKGIKIPMPHFSLGTEHKKFLGVSIPVPKFDIQWYAKGTPFVPETGLYGLHKGEAVIPASQNKVAGAGGIVVNINGGNYFGDMEEIGNIVSKAVGKKVDFNHRF